MSVFSNNDHSGIIWLLGCLITITLTGVFMTTLVDRFHNREINDKVSYEHIYSHDKELDQLREQFSSLDNLFHLTKQDRQRVNSEITAIQNHTLILKQRLLSLTKEKSQLVANIDQKISDLNQLKQATRDRIWKDAKGKTIRILSLNSKKELRNVTITAVMPYGLNLKTETGSVQVDFLDLPAEYKNRFQWIEEERDRALAGSIDLRSKLSSSTRNFLSKDELSTKDKRVADENLSNTLASQISILRERLSSIKIQINTANQEMNSGKNHSMPGSLRTWTEQLNILQVAEEKVTATLSGSLEKLRMISPEHPALGNR